MPSLDEHQQTRLFIATVAAALCRALAERDEGLSTRFEKELERAYREMEDYESMPTGALEALQWTGQLVRATR